MIDPLLAVPPVMRWHRLFLMVATMRSSRLIRSRTVAALAACAVCAGSLLLTTPAAHAQSTDVDSRCSDDVRVNLPTEPLTQARIDRDAGALRDAFTAYLQASNAARQRDQDALRSERNGLPAIPAPRASSGGSADSMPLDRSVSYYADAAALAVAREIVSFQVPSGGWGKNLPRTGVPRARGQPYIADAIDPDSHGGDGWRYVGTIDNGATTTEIRFLARVQAAQVTDRAALRGSIVSGLAYLIAAQYPNGGWPQVYPLAGGYNDAITLNDNAMLSVGKLLNDVGTGADADFAFVDDALRTRAQAAARSGIAWFLAHQVVIDGRRTLWGQQHDALSQQPTAARAYEMPALASFESARIVDFLMTLPTPDDATRRAVHDAAAFLEATRIEGKRYNRSTGTLDADDRGAAWARFYDLGTYDPTASRVEARACALFGDRPATNGSRAYGLVFGSLAPVSAERRRGYAQYNDAGVATIARFRRWRAANPR